MSDPLILVSEMKMVSAGKLGFCASYFLSPPREKRARQIAIRVLKGGEYLVLRPL